MVDKEAKLSRLVFKVVDVQRESNNKLAIITGAAGALGSALTLECACAGWETILIDKNLQGLESLFDSVVGKGGIEPSIHPLNLESMGTQDCQDIVAAVEAGAGRLDALVHCAVVFEGLRPLEHIDPQDWLRQVQINLSAPWLLSVSCLPLLRQSAQASLIFLSEDLDKVSGANWGTYGITKNAIDTLARMFSAELNNSNIKVSSFNPGPLRSALRARAYHSEDPLDAVPANAAATALRQIMERKATVVGHQQAFGDAV